MRALGIDPGLETGWAVLFDARAPISVASYTRPTRAERREDPRVWSSAFASPDGAGRANTIWRAGTVKFPRDPKAASSPWPPWIDALGQEVAQLIVEWEPEVVGVESFEHQGWRGRRIALEAEMGMAVARVISTCELLGVRVISVRPADTAANTEALLHLVATTHEQRAIGAALWAAGSVARAR